MENTIEKTVSTIWQKSKWIVKGGIIGVLALLLMIPMIYVKDLVYERAQRQIEATNEISSKWAGAQNITGPVIGIPFWQKEEGDTSSKAAVSRHIAYFLPDNLNVIATMTSKEKHRGIFKVMLYDSKSTLTGSFNSLSIDKLNIPADKFIWNEAFVKINISDPKGLSDQLKIKWKEKEIELSPQTDDSNGGMTALLNTTSAEDFNNISFTSSIDLSGSEQLMITPVGRSTTINCEGNWKHPSFSGSMLPQTTNVSNNGFKATWKSMAHKRNFPQQWIDNTYRTDYNFPKRATIREDRYFGNDGKVDFAAVSSSLGSSAFGVDLFIPVNGYQKTLRTVKYAMLCILLTFAAFFLIETTQKKSAHPFQYGLIGLALILFYTLLLSFSEYTGFDAAYIIASVATIGLIGWFVKSILQSGRATTILSLILVLIYSYIFSLLQLQDYSLLLGSIGLFLTLAVIMYFSRKIKW